MSERAFTVEGMTCDHCVQAVTREVAAVPGVVTASVDLASKQLTVHGDAAEAAIAEAVEEAGYTLAH
ncbi:MAG: heavy-metal-associated domain-containing protein [Actinomycetales bacterium]|nr:heavy-metal-associated domain-containing protein [Actinomycetales bacterium]